MVTITAASSLEAVALERLSGPHRRGVQVLCDQDWAAWQAATDQDDVISAARLASTGLVLWGRSWWLQRTTCGFAVRMPYPDNSITREAVERLMSSSINVDELEHALTLLDLERVRRGLSFPGAIELDAESEFVADSDLIDGSTHSLTPALLECGR